VTKAYAQPKRKCLLRAGDPAMKVIGWCARNAPIRFMFRLARRYTKVSVENGA
jgi:hypothetical protein